MSKYDPLKTYLERKGEAQIPMSFSEVEKVIGVSLPPSARMHRPWWSNNPSNSVITYAWLAAGYKTRAVNMEAEELIFERVDNLPSEPQVPASRSGNKSMPAKGEHPLLGSLQGSVTFTGTFDITLPADEGWADLADG